MHDDRDWGTVYTNPARFGLEVVGSVDWTDEPYEFNMTVVWRDQEGQLYYGSDAGCSCPSPFEDFHSLDDLTKATPTDLVRYLNEQADSDRARGQAAELSTLVFGNEKYR